MQETTDNVAPLHVTTALGHLDVVKFFISELNCDPNTPGCRNLTPLHYAAENGHIQTVEYHLIVEELKDAIHHLRTAIMSLHFIFASMNGHLNTIKYLILEKECNPMQLGDNM